MTPYEAALKQPLVVFFCWERFDLLRMTLPRVVNATRRIGGYLWAVDDGSDDDRVPRLLKAYENEEYINCISFGRISRFIDWTGFGPGKGPARRSVVLRWLFRKNVPLAFLVESDMVIGKTMLSDMMERAYKVLSEGYTVSAFCGTSRGRDVLGEPPLLKENFYYTFFGPYLSQQVVLLPFGTMKKTHGGRAMRAIKDFSLNEYAALAWEEGYPSCYLFNLQAQHIGIGIAGSSVNIEDIRWDDMNYTVPGGELVGVEGFDLPGFIESTKTTMHPLQRFCLKDHLAQAIDPPGPVDPYFPLLVERETLPPS